MGSRSKKWISLRCFLSAGNFSRRLSLRATGNSSQSNGGDEIEKDEKSAISRVGEILTLGFPLWVSSACALALVRPSAFDVIQPKWQILGITLTMLGD